MKKNLRLLLLTSALLCATPASAFVTVTGFAGSYLASGETGMFGGEVTLNLIPMFDFGAFYEYSQTNSTSSSGYARNFAGGVARCHLPFMNFFVDTRIGYHTDQDVYGYTLSGFYAEGGVGYSFEIIPGMLSVQPRIGTTIAAFNSTYPILNASGMISLSL